MLSYKSRVWLVPKALFVSLMGYILQEFSTPGKQVYTHSLKNMVTQLVSGTQSVRVRPDQDLPLYNTRECHFKHLIVCCAADRQLTSLLLSWS